MCPGSLIRSRCCSVLLSGLMITMAIHAVDAAEKKGSSMSYAEAREFLAKHTDLVELTNDAGGWPSPRSGKDA